MPDNIGRRKTFRSTDFFRNEINFFTGVLPRFMDFQARRNIEAPVAFTEIPKCVASLVDGQNDFIVLEDLAVDGYAAPNRQDGLDLAHCKLLMKTLGKLHGISLAIKDQEPELFKKCIDSVEVNFFLVICF